ncbi:MAG: hypothetical protein QXP54_00005, partial [Thermofilum sp.]
LERGAEAEEIVALRVTAGRGAEAERIEAVDAAIEREASVEALLYVSQARIHPEADVARQEKVEKLSEDLSWCREQAGG